MEITRYTSVFKALSEPVRLRIIYLLLQQSELCVCDIVDALDLSQSVVSRHLAYLRNSGLVETRREGVWVYYQLVQRDIFVSQLLALFQDEGGASRALQHDAKRLSLLSNRSCS